MIKIVFSSLGAVNQNCLALTVAADKKLGPEGTKLNSKLGGALKRAMENSYFTGAKDQTLIIHSPAKTRLTQIILLGIGDIEKVDALMMQHVGGHAVSAAGLRETQITILVDTHKGLGLEPGQAAAEAAYGARLRAYSFDKYHTKRKPEQKSHLRTVTLATSDAPDARVRFLPLDKIVDGVFYTRDLVSEPPNVIFPESLAEACRKLKDLGVKVDVLDEKRMKALGMGALLGVGQGSTQPSRLVSMTWTGDPTAKDKKPFALVGKGVTFDTGGISLKPPPGMEDMKWDMAGAGAVIGAMKALAGRKAKANVVGVVALVENMPSGSAQRPGDVVTTMSGQTVEVLNTDAEGRLVLADALWYVQETFNPRCIVDLATLTGAIIVALGHEFGGIFSNDDALCERLISAGKGVGEQLWRFPLADAFDKDIDSAIADMRNIGSRGEAGSIIGAQFLQRFVKKGTPWAHLDIAGMAWQGRDKPNCPKGATAFGVRLLDQFVGG